jgi:hypothetical protein
VIRQGLQGKIKACPVPLRDGRRYSKASFLDFQIYFTACAAVRAVRLNLPGKMTAI